ncbi:MAG: type II secretion system protein [SAR202 cluster bacterium]|nr:type II secretion system protein [SAR202 cluster bacterium]
MKLFKKILQCQAGFTLIEMVVVIAIMGVMAGVAVPATTKHIDGAKARGYEQDLAMIQIAVDSFYTSADNERHLGLRQFPILAGSQKGASVLWDDTSTTAFSEIPANPALGIRGGEPYWTDNRDGFRRAEDNVLLSQATAVTDAGVGGFYPSKVEIEGTFYAVDSRGYFIDFAPLIKAKLLRSAPLSASVDNGGVEEGSDGSYIWYLDSRGQVNSILASFPYNGLHFSGVPIAGAKDRRGFQKGIYP